MYWYFIIDVNADKTINHGQCSEEQIGEYCGKAKRLSKRLGKHLRIKFYSVEKHFDYYPEET